MSDSNSALANVRALDGFVSKLHSEPYTRILPSSNPLPSPFHVVVLGATGAIGRSTALSYARAGATHITLAARRLSILNQIADSIRNESSSQVTCVECDISSATSMAALAAHLHTSADGRLDAVVLVAGMSGPVTLSLTDGSPEVFEQVTRTNYLGTYYALHYLVPLLVQTNGGAKAFVAISSIAAAVVTGPIANAQYCVSKLAQLRLVQYAHEQFCGQGVLVVGVHPGAVASENALDTAPEMFKAYLTDSDELAGGWCVWLCRERMERAERVDWMGGRLVSATWDLDELLGRKDEIVRKDLLKLVVSC